jgi:hypothetical protein
MKKILLFTVFSILVIANSFGQRSCGSMDYLADQLAADPTLQQKMDAINMQAQQFAAGKKTRTIVTIPVVFHVVYNTAAQNISDAQCIAQLNQLNLDFAHLNTDATNTPAAFSGLAANTQIQFCLAVRDPLGNTTTGITHTPTTVTSFSTNNNIKFASSGGHDAWPRDQYLNIWVCNLGSSLLGYAQFPGGAAATDGVVVLYTSVGSMLSPNPGGGSYDIGRTATHEVGHWLNMRHIWADDGGACSGAGAGTGDLVGDTPDQGDNNYGCPTYPLLDACQTAAPGVMFMNYMDYVDDACMNMFTAGQATRMGALFAVGGARYPLLNSLGCTSVAPCSGTPFAGAITLSNTDTLCSGSKTLFLNGATTGTGISVQWESSADQIAWGNAVGVNNGISYSAPATSGVMYYRAYVTCATSGMSDTSNIVAVYSYGVNSVSGNTTICSGGQVTLTANGIGTMNWYNTPTATTPVFTGNPFTTNVASSATFYVNSGSSTKYTVGAVDYSIGGTSTSNTLSSGLYFKVSTDLTIDTVFVYPGSAGNVVVNIQDSITSASIGTASITVTAAQVNTKVPVLLNITCPATKTYKMIATGSTVTSLYRNTSGSSFPYTIPGVISIFKNVSGNNNGYRYFYDWRISSGCATAKVAVPITTAPVTMTSTSTSILCNGAGGNVTANAGIGYTYTLNGANANTTGNFTNVTAGNYTVSATSASGCSASTTITITQPTPIVLTNTSIDNTGGCNGSVSASATGGTGAYTYSINGGAVQSTGTFSNLCTGLYTLCVTDANNCSVCTTAIINSLNFITVYGATTTACVGSANGTITGNVVGGTPPYAYNINGGAYSINNLFTGLAAGTYTIGAKDAINITNTTVVTIINSSLAVATTGFSTPSATICTGYINATASGGVGPYQYSINGGAFGAGSNFPNLCFGTYTVCTQDAQGCSACHTYTVLIVVPITVTAPSLVQACPGMNNGSITAIAQNGTQPYQYSINGGAFGSNAQFNNLAAGVYTITAKDVDNVTTTVVADLTLSGSLNLISSAFTDPKCYNTCDGTVIGIANAGVSAYTYSLNGGAYQANSTFSNLCGANYTIQVKDANNCTANTVIKLTTPQPITITLVTNNIDCNGQLNGNIAINANGGLAPYQYTNLPSPYGTYYYFNGLGAGTYTLMAKDVNNCTVTTLGTITEPPVLQLTGTTSPNTGTITINVIGGTPTYMYSINGGQVQTSNVFTGLGAGTYSLMVTDSKGCRYATAVILQAPENLASVQLGQSIGIYPNPSNGIVTINIDSDKAIGLLQVRILNDLGQIVVRDMMEVNGKKAKKTLHLEHLPTATYTIQITDEHQAMYVHKLVIQ